MRFFILHLTLLWPVPQNRAMLSHLLPRMDCERWTIETLVFAVWGIETRVRKVMSA